MVVSKRCKVCTVLDAENIPIWGEYFGKVLPDLVLNTCGIDLDPRKANGVLICQLCALQLLQADAVIGKLRNSLDRLKKLEKNTKRKTPLRQAAPIQNKRNDLKDAVHNDEQTYNMSEDIDDLKTQEILESEATKKIVRRKSIFPDGNNIANHSDSEKKLSNTASNGNFKKILDNEVTPLKTSSKGSKRKPPTDMSLSNNKSYAANVIEPSAIKRNKTLPPMEEIPMDLSVDEQQENELYSETKFEDTNTKEINCILCGKAFHKKSVLRDHIDTNHMGERLKSCPHCSSEFRSQQKYESHVFSEKCKNTNHACQYPRCNKRFKTIHKMELHMQLKHSSQNVSTEE